MFLVPAPVRAIDCGVISRQLNSAQQQQMNQSGIHVGEALSKKVADLSSSIRALKISIIGESLDATEELKASGTLEEDFDRINGLIADDEAAYLLIRDEIDDTKFVFASYVPDTAKVKDKMKYASTRNTLSRELGTAKFSTSHFATTRDELTYAAVFQKDQSSAAETPLSEKERDIRDIKAAEDNVNTTSSKRAIVAGGVTFPVSEAAQQALNVLKTASTSRMVALTIDIEKETIELASDKEMDIEELSNEIPTDKPQYLFFAYVHEFEGTGTTTQCFIYTCPSSSKVKERMLYSSNRQSVSLSTGYPITVKLECEDLDIADLKQRIHPPKAAAQTGFSRPKRPGKK